AKTQTVNRKNHGNAPLQSGHDPETTFKPPSSGGIKVLRGVQLIDKSVAVSVAIPGAVNTAITQNSNVDTGNLGRNSSAANPALPPAKAASIILDGMEAGKLDILVGKDAKLLNLLWRIAPAWSIGFVQREMAKM
ncbi:hypothetical protein ABRA89_17680, partial [Fulvimarina sp. MAC8]